MTRLFSAAVAALLVFATAAEAQRPPRARPANPGAAVSVSPAPTLSGYDFFVVAGQSNANGKGNAAQSEGPAPGEGYEQWRQGNMEPLADPVQTSNDGSAWPAFAKAYAEQTGRGAIILMLPRSGTIQHKASGVPANKSWDILYEDNLYDWASDIAARTFVVAEASLPDVQFGGWLWIQGGADAYAIEAGREVPADYEAALHRMSQQIVADWNAPLFLVVTGSALSGDFPEAQAVRAIQNEADAMEEVVVIHRDALQFAARGWHVDDVHWDQRGLNEVGLVGGTAAGAYLHGGTPPPDPDPEPGPTPDPGPSDGTLVVAPNPSVGTPSVRHGCEARYRLFDSMGRQIDKGRSRPNGKIKLPPLAPGQYVIRVRPVVVTAQCTNESATFTVVGGSY